MNQKDLQTELLELENRLTELTEKEDKTQTDVRELNKTCDQIEQVTSELRAFDHQSGAVSVTTRSGPSENELRYFGEYLQAVACSVMEPGRTLGRFQTGQVYRDILMRETRSAGLEESTPSLGGFLVSKQMSDDIFIHSQKTAKVWPRIRTIPISGNRNGLKLPYVDETSRANGSRWGGIRGYWTEEGGEKTASKPKFGQMELSLEKLTLLAYSSDELLEDSLALGQLMFDGFADELAFKLDDSFINGTGAGQPLGVLNAGCIVSVAKETGQAVRTILWQNIKKMFSRAWGGSWENLIWLVNQNCLPELFSLSQPVGTGGVPVFQAANLPKMELFTRPIIPVEQCATLGTVGDILLVDPTQYVSIRKGALQMAQSMHVRFIYDEMTFRGVYRTDGQPMWSSSLTPYKDASTTEPVSPFISLATRS